MARMTIRLDPGDKAWLKKHAAATSQTATQIVRDCLGRLRREESSFLNLIKETRGIWRAGNGLSYQRKARREWH